MSNYGVENSTCHIDFLLDFILKVQGFFFLGVNFSQLVSNCGFENSTCYNDFLQDLF